jgi:transcriptional regulator with XRE-family HTH domain
MDTELGNFLRMRRARLRPEEVGVVSHGARRVPGLRREELAQLAGVSVTYYTRLEQGQSHNASDDVLDAIARALQLDLDEIAHLRNLARPLHRKRRGPVKPEAARPGIMQLLSAMDGVAAICVDRRSDVLAWNLLGHQLLGSHYGLGSPASLADRPNLIRMLFLDPHTRELYSQWNVEAKRSVASLRLVVGAYPNDRHLGALIGELSMQSEEFSTLWSRHPVLNCTFGAKHFSHPVVGQMTLQFEVVQLPDDSGHRILMYSAEADSSSETALVLLNQNARRSEKPTAAVANPAHRNS